MTNTVVKNFIGIDISKLTFDLSLIVDLNKDNILYKVFPNSLQGIKEMKQWLKANKVNLEETVFCMEHTGIYCRVLVDFLTKNDYKTWLEMPIVIKRSMGLQRGKKIKRFDDSKRTID